MKTLRIGEVAQQAGVGVETVRFLERTGLLEEPQRKASSYRQYDEETVDALRFIRRAKELGFTLKEIKTLLDLRLDTSATRAEVREQARDKVADIEAKIADLQRMRDSLLIGADSVQRLYTTRFPGCACWCFRYAPYLTA